MGKLIKFCSRKKIQKIGYKDRIKNDEMHFKNTNEYANICNKLNFKRLNFYGIQNTIIM